MKDVYVITNLLTCLGIGLIVHLALWVLNTFQTF